MIENRHKFAYVDFFMYLCRRKMQLIVLFRDKKVANEVIDVLSPRGTITTCAPFL